jgi:DNA-binding NarL/FixJ family response regulator
VPESIIVSGRVLVVEDEAMVARSWMRLLSLDGWTVQGADTLNAALDVLADGDEFDVVLLDVVLPDGSGVSLLPELNRQRPVPKIVVITASADASLAVELTGQVDAVIPKPMSPGLLRTLLAKIATDVSSAQLKDFARHYQLSPNETRLLELASWGADMTSLAEALGCKRSAINTYWKRISKKTGARGQRNIFAKLWRWAQTVR